MWKTLVYGNEIIEDFEISEEGVIRNKFSGKEYKHYVGKGGYPLVSLPMGKRGVVKTLRLHKAIAENFISNPYNLTVVHHIDENKENFSISNLMWVTHKQNTDFHLTKLSQQNKLYNNRKLTMEQAQEIRNLKKTMSYNELSKKFGVSKPTIANVCKMVHYI